MRSTATGAGQEGLWCDEPSDAAAVPKASARTPSGRRGGHPRAPWVPDGTWGGRAASGQGWTWTLEGQEFARRGWHPGTVLHLVPTSRAQRGDLVVVRDGERHRVGFLGLDLGRPALLTDAGATWLAERARVVAVATSVEAPLAP